MPITNIELPHVGESVTEGIIGRWLKQPGERVEKYDALVEVVTDKVSMEVPCPYTGTLVKTLVSEGDTVPMGQPIAEMEVEEAGSSRATVGEAQIPVRPELVERRTDTPALGGTSSVGARAERSARSVASPRNFEFMDTVRSVGPTGSGEGGQGRPDYELEQKAVAARFGEGAEGGRPAAGQDMAERYHHGTRRVSQAPTGPFLSPLVRRLVAQHSVDVALVRGTGMGGRITKDDVLRHVEERRVSTPPAYEAAGGPMDAPLLAARAIDEDTTVLPLTPLRRTIAEHMARSAREIPAAWTMVEADVTGLVRWRRAHREAFERSHGVLLTYLPVAAQAVAQALRENPRLNGRWDGDRILLSNRVHLGIAVSTDAGLIVPVVHDADNLSVAGLARRAAELIEAARTRSLRLEDVQGGTFTLNNTGALGSVLSAPIINHPQVAILTTEAIVKRAVVIEGDAIAVRSMMNICLTFDHRVCDGSEASAFLRSVKARLEAVDEQTPLA